jgi:hypothetical protein
VEYGGQKYRRLAWFSSRAGQPRAGMIASGRRFNNNVHTNLFVCTLHRKDCC